ncbi:MAG: cation:proton antiporter [Hyphomicrobiaceae bacterium]
MENYKILLALGGLLLVGLVADQIGRRTKLPRVTLLLLFGFAAGQSGFDMLPDDFREWYDFLATVALTMVAFLLGGKLSRETLQENGKAILIISLSVVVVTVLIVGTGLLLIGAPFLMALLLAGLATATAPAATQDVVRQTGAKGPFRDTLLGVVAIDDAWGLIIFSLILVVAKAMLGDGSLSIVSNTLWEIGGAAIIGLGIGLPAAYLTGRLQDGEPIQAEALGIVFLCAGFSIWFEVSFLLAGMVAGATIVNLARHHNRPFHEIEHIEWPFMILFFVLAGALFDLESLQLIGVVGFAYIVLRTFARFLGGWVGASLAGAPKLYQTWIGAALIPQAGVALGMALIAGNYLPQIKEVLLVTVIGTTVVFELIGPILTQIALRQVGEAHEV